MNHLKPAEILKTSVASSVEKSNGSFKKLFLMGIMAGAYIAFAGSASNMGAFNLLNSPETYGLGRAVAGTIFTGGLIIILLAGGELFTGNTLMPLAVIEKKITARKMLRNWVIVYIANFIGSVLVAFMIYNSGLFDSGSQMLGAITVKIAAGKVNMTFLSCFVSGILCNWLVCLAVWSATGASSTVDKIFASFFPILLFATNGFEHSIANMYFIPAGIMASSNESFVALSGVTSEAISNLNWIGMLDNLLPVTLGNIVGGSLCVAIGYWSVVKEKN
jgi:formate/nitrite transporter